jgi:uncharacterized protein YndB with AHSA1/START domain
MRWILLAVVAIAAAVAVAALIGWRLPRSHRASREVMMAATPESIWAAITDVEAFPSWRTDVKTVRRLPDREGRRAWVEDGGSGTITFVVERSDAPRLLVTRIADPDLPFGGTWTYEITPAPQGSRLRITEDGEIYNPLFRFMSRFVFGYEATMASYLTALEVRLDPSSRRAR